MSTLLVPHYEHATVYCAVPGTGDHPWGTLPHTLEPAR